MNALEFNNKIANLITGFIANIPTIGQFDPKNERPNKDFIPIIELVNLNYQLNPNDHSSQLNITLKNNLDSGEEEFDEFLQNKVYQYIHNFIDNLTELTELHAIPVNNTQLIFKAASPKKFAKQRSRRNFLILYGNEIFDKLQ